MAKYLFYSMYLFMVGRREGGFLLKRFLEKLQMTYLLLKENSPNFPLLKQLKDIVDPVWFEVKWQHLQSSKR